MFCPTHPKMEFQNLDIRPVFNSNASDYEDALYFYVKFDSDCSICLEYHTNPYILPCGHIFCMECINDSIMSEFKDACCVCRRCFRLKDLKKVVFFFKNTINDFILFKRIDHNKSNLTFFEYPHATEYNENENATRVKHFYQSADGQLYFLNSKQKYLTKNKPLYLAGHIKRIERFEGSNHNMPEYKHMKRYQTFYIVTLQ